MKYTRTEAPINIIFQSRLPMVYEMNEVKYSAKCTSFKAFIAVVVS
jgi:hypothetical protein